MRKLNLNLRANAYSISSPKFKVWTKPYSIPEFVTDFVGLKVENLDAVKVIGHTVKITTKSTTKQFYAHTHISKSLK